MVAQVSHTSALSPSQKRALVAPLVVFGTTRGFDSSVQYRGVYRHAGGWRAKVKFFGTRGVTPSHTQINLSTHREAVDAAVELAHWWEGRLGPRWAEILRCAGGKRGCVPGDEGGRVWRNPSVPWRIHRDKKADKRRGVQRLYVVCWVRGVTTRVPGWFPSRRDAAHGLFSWLERERAGKGWGPGPLLWLPEDAPERVRDTFSR